MKLVIASDIHGSAFWCGRLMDAIDAESPDKVVLLGDLLYHGPRNALPEGYDPNQVAGMLNGIAGSIVAVRGNCDAEVDQMVLSFSCMADYALVMDGAYQLFCTHGHLWSPDNLPPLAGQGAFLYGHTHVKRNEDAGGVRLVNPGSVSIPKDDGNSFALYEDGAFQLRSLR